MITDKSVQRLHASMQCEDLHRDLSIKHNDLQLQWDRKVQEKHDTDQQFGYLKQYAGNFTVPNISKSSNLQKNNVNVTSFRRNFPKKSLDFVNSLEYGCKHYGLDLLNPHQLLYLIDQGTDEFGLEDVTQRNPVEEAEEGLQGGVDQWGILGVLLQKSKMNL